MSLPAAALPLTAASPSIAALAEQCVKCGLCLAHCPTYRVMGVEGESPRGRIAYGSALDLAIVDPTPTLRAQLDDCLACGTCEVVCPTKVRYDDLLVATRVAIDATRDETSMTTHVRRSAQRRSWWRLLQRFRHWPIAALARALPRFRRLLEMIPALPAPATFPRITGAATPRLGKALLFRGCVASALDSDTHAAAIQVLSAVGFEVEAPDAPLCCGALDRHAGDVSRASASATRARDIIQATGCDSVVSTATGCHRDLAAHVDDRTVDLFALLSPHVHRLPPLEARALKVAFLAPCTQPHAIPADAIRRIVSLIPGVEWTNLPLQPRCCGAAGVYFVDHPHIAEPLRAERVAQINASRPDVVLTTNIGCRVYLRAGLLKAGLDIPVIHPIQLIADALP